MKILMVGPNAHSKGGIATVIANFKLFYRDNQVFYFDSWKETTRLSTGIQAFFRIKKNVKKMDIDIVHFHVAQKGSFYRKSLLAKRIRKQTRLIFHMHASQFDTFYEDASPRIKKYISKTLDQLDGLVVLSQEWANFYQTITKTPITIIENAVEIPEAVSYESKSTELITLGRIGMRKGSYDTLQLAKRIQPVFPEVKFILYGDGELDTIEQQIKAENITNVYLGGWISKEEQKKIMKKSVLHLLPSYQEGLPMSILETMSYGVPNLTTNVGGIPQVLRDGENGMVVKPGDIDAMFEKLSMFLEDEEFRIKCSLESFKTIKTHFSIVPYFEKWNQLYEDIMIIN